MSSNKQQTATGLPKFLEDDRLPWLKWIKYMGEDCVADVDYEKSIKAHRPIINIYFCMTKAMNGCVLQSVNFVPELFTESKL